MTMIAPHLHALAARLYEPRTVETVFAPMLADLQVEWEEAAVRGRWPARRVLLAGHWHFARTVASLAREHGGDRLASMPWILFLPVLLTSVVGVSLMRDPVGLAKPQAIYLAVASVLTLAAALVPRRWLIGGRAIFAILGVGLLALVALRGISYGGATKWVSIAGLLVFPGELVRPLLLIALAGELETHARRRSGRALASFVVVAASFVTLVALQPDPGVAVVLLAAVGCMAWVGAGPRFGRVVAAVCTGAALAALVSSTAVMSPDPARHTDLVLLALRERAGLAGTAFLVAVALSTVWVVRSAASRIEDAFARSVVAGLSGATVAQTTLHVGAACGALPQLGVALPTVSYGGSALVAHWLSLGLVAGIVLHASERRIGEAAPPV